MSKLISLKYLAKPTKQLVGALACLSVTLSPAVLAADDVADIGEIFTNVTKVFGPIVSFVIAICYILGIALATAGIMKFKAHKDNPTQVTLGGPLTLVAVAAALMFAPAIIQTSGESIFGGDLNMTGTGFVGTSRGYDPFTGRSDDDPADAP